MAEWTRKVQPGQSMRNMPAKAYNEFINAALRTQDMRRVGDVGRYAETEVARGYVWVINEAGSDLGAKRILGLEEIDIKPTDNELEYNQRLCYRGVTPAIPDHLHKFCILIQDAPNDQVFVRAKVAGPVQVRLYVNDVNHKYAIIKDTETAYLETTPFGGCPIHWQESGTGEVDAVVMLGQPVMPVQFAEATSAPAGGTLTVKLANSDGTTSGPDLTVYDGGL